VTEKILAKSAKQYFSIRIGVWEFVLWKITYEAENTLEQVKPPDNGLLRVNVKGAN
jgi:hypothetical protein